MLKVFTYLVEADVPFFYEKRTIQKWNSKTETKNKVLETEMDGEKMTFRMINDGGNNFGIELKNAKNREEILYTKGKEEKLNTFKAIRKVHEVTNQQISRSIGNSV